MQRIIELGDPTANYGIHDELISVGREFGKRFGYQSKAIMALIELFGENPLDVLPPIVQKAPIKKESPTVLAIIPPNLDNTGENLND